MTPKNSSSVSKASSPSGFLGQGTIDIIVAPRMLRCSKCRINQGELWPLLLRDAGYYHDGSIPMKDSMGDGKTSVSSMAYTQHQGSSHYGCVFHPLINGKNLAYGITTDSPKQSGTVWPAFSTAFYKLLYGINQVNFYDPPVLPCFLCHPIIPVNSEQTIPLSWQFLWIPYHYSTIMMISP